MKRNEFGRGKVSKKPDAVLPNNFTQDQEIQEDLALREELEIEQIILGKTEKVEFQGRRSPLTSARNRRMREERAEELLKEEGIEPPGRTGMNPVNALPDEFTDNRPPSKPVRKTGPLATLDGGGIGALPPESPRREADLKRKTGSTKEAERRMRICRECPELLKLDRCRRCGCFMRIKTQVPAARCPLLKW